MKIREDKEKPRIVNKVINKLIIAIFVIKLINLKSFFKLMKYGARRIFLRQDIPGVAILALTYKCQSNCLHCSAGIYQINSEELQVAEWKQLIDQLDILGVPRIHISGGEPTLKEGFELIVEYACSKGMIVFFESNGYALNKEIVMHLKKIGVASIDISLDSTDSGIHDKLRGLNGSFQRAIAAIGFCKELNIPHMVSTYATKENIYSGELTKLIYFARDMDVSAIRILPPQPSGRWLNKQDASLGENDKKYLRSRFPIYAILDRLDLPLCPIRVKYSVFVGPDGEIHPCPHLPFSFGNVRQVKVESALQSMAENVMFKNKSICYINDQEFRRRFIIPLLNNNKKFPIKIG